MQKGILIVSLFVLCDLSSASLFREVPLDTLQGVSNVALNESHYLYKVKEPLLYKEGYLLTSGSPGLYASAFSKQRPRAKYLAKYGYATLTASKFISQRLRLTRTEAFGLASIPIKTTNLYNECPFQSKGRQLLKPSCPAYSKVYRTADGSCNNQKHPDWGSAMQPYIRYLPPVYTDVI